MAEGDRSLTDSVGPENASRIALAYDRAVSILSLNDRYLVPSRAARLGMIQAMLSAGREHGYDEDRLTLAALAAARSD